MFFDQRCFLRKNLFVCCSATLLCVAGKASAAPASLTLYPSTDIYPRGRFHLDSDIASGNFRRTTFASVGLNLGLGPGRDGLFGRSDIGIEYLPAPLSGVSAGNRVVFNAKTQLVGGGPMTLRIAMGFRGLGNRGNPEVGNSVGPRQVGYIVGSKMFGRNRFHLGIARSFAPRAFIVTPGGNAARTYLHLGYDRALSNKFRFTADYYSGKSALSAFAPGIIYYVDEKASFQLGYIRYNDASIDPCSQIYGGFNYDFGGEFPPRDEKTDPRPQ